MNTFALLLLAFPFYLAVNGKLVPGYTNLATQSSATAPAPNKPAAAAQGS